VPYSNVSLCERSTKLFRSLHRHESQTKVLLAVWASFLREIGYGRSSQETHYVSATEPSRLILFKCKVFTAVTMENAVPWHVLPCSSCKNRRFGESPPLRKTLLRSLLQLLVTANLVASELILFVLMMGAIRCPETSVLIKATWRHFTEYWIL
jgi:hypothetical protein